MQLNEVLQFCNYYSLMSNLSVLPLVSCNNNEREQQQFENKRQTRKKHKRKFEGQIKTEKKQHQKVRKKFEQVPIKRSHHQTQKPKQKQSHQDIQYYINEFSQKPKYYEPTTGYQRNMYYQDTFIFKDTKTNNNLAYSQMTSNKKQTPYVPSFDFSNINSKKNQYGKSSWTERPNYEYQPHSKSPVNINFHQYQNQVPSKYTQSQLPSAHQQTIKSKLMSSIQNYELKRSKLNHSPHSPRQYILNQSPEREGINFSPVRKDSLGSSFSQVNFINNGRSPQISSRSKSRRKSKDRGFNDVNALKVKGSQRKSQLFSNEKKPIKENQRKSINQERQTNLTVKAPPQSNHQKKKNHAQLDDQLQDYLRQAIDSKSVTQPININTVNRSDRY